MANPPIPRDQVHALCEACSDAGDGFQSTASRLIKHQRRLSRFFEQNLEPLGATEGQVALYMLAVSMRVFDQVGGRMRKVTGADIANASSHVEAAVDQLLPADKDFGKRAKAIKERAQPHLLDEVIWALYERSEEESKKEEVTLDPEKSALIYVMLWTAIEAMDANWTPAS